jgi:hypothetical protein
MSYLFTSSSFPKVRQEGFHTQSSIQSPSGAQGQQSQRQQHLPTPNAFDPNAIYTTGALFADQYRATPADPFARRYEQQQQPQQQQAPSSHSLDIHDELSFLNPPTSATSGTYRFRVSLIEVIPTANRLIQPPTFIYRNVPAATATKAP